MNLAMPAERFVHPALFYRDDNEYVTGTAPFIRAGLAAGEPVAVTVPPRNLELLRRELGVQADRVVMLDMTRAGRNPGRIIPGVLRAFADAHPTGHVRIIGEPVWFGRGALEYPACAQHEALINLAFTGRDVTILCPYDAKRLDPLVLADAWVTHPMVIDEFGLRGSDRYDPYGLVARYNEPLPDPPASAATVAFDTGNHSQARRFALERGVRLGLGSNRLVDLELAIGELIANSVVHGGGRGELTVWTEPGLLICQVHDAGHITNPLAGRIPAEPDQLGGRGLVLVNLLTDLVRTHTSPAGTTIRVHFTY